MKKDFLEMIFLNIERLFVVDNELLQRVKNNR